MSKTRTCTICGTVTDDWCPTCLANFETRRAASEMSVAERVAELEAWGEHCEIPFDKIQRRWEELIGRSVSTHEFAKPRLLIEEVRRQQPATFDGMLAEFPEGKPVVVVETP